MLENDENENGDSGLQGKNLPRQEVINTPGLDVFGPPSYVENKDSGEQENQNLLDTLGHEDFFPPNYAEQLDCVEEDKLLESKGATIIEGIESDEVAKYSERQKCMHVKRTGLFKIRVTCEGVPSPDDSTFYIRVMLVRDHEGFTHIPVDQVCEKHDEGDELKKHVLRYSKDYNFYPAIYVNGYRPSIVVEVPPPEDGNIVVTMGVYFKCNDSCVTSQQMVSESKSMAHKARDLRLVTTLEIRKNFKMEIIQRNSMLLWIKAALDKTHLIREHRRGPQGGLAQKLKRENNEPEPGTSTSTSTSTSNKKKRKIGDHKVKVPACGQCGQPAPPVDHMEELLKERVYREEDQVAAADQMYLEMLGKVKAHNEAVNKNPQ